MDTKPGNTNLTMEKVGKWLIPVLAVMIMAESLWIVINATNLQGKWQPLIPGGIPGIKIPATGGEIVLEKGEKRGSTSLVNVMLQPSSQRLIDGVDVVIGFEPKTAGIRAVEGESGLEMVRQVVDEENGKLIMTFLVDENAAGERVSEPVALAVLQVTGQTKLTPIQAESVMTEAGSSKQFVLSGNPLQLD